MSPHDSISGARLRVAAPSDGALLFKPHHDAFCADPAQTFSTMKGRAEALAETPYVDATADDAAPRASRWSPEVEVFAGKPVHGGDLSRAFKAPDGDHLTYSATVVPDPVLGQADWPEWLTLDPLTGHLSGRAPVDVSSQDLWIWLTAQDPAGNALTRDMTLTISRGGVQYGDEAADTLHGAAGEDVLLGNGGDDLLIGARGADTLKGGDGVDTLSGGGGDDYLWGEAGQDHMAGGQGADTFIYYGVEGSPVAEADLISDFRSDQGDRLNLYFAYSGASGEPKFVGQGPFTGVEGQVRYVVRIGEAVVLGDTDGDRHADFKLHLTGVSELHASDFVS